MSDLGTLGGVNGREWRRVRTPWRPAARTLRRDGGASIRGTSDLRRVHEDRRSGLRAGRHSDRLRGGAAPTSPRSSGLARCFPRPDRPPTCMSSFAGRDSRIAHPRHASRARRPVAAACTTVTPRSPSAPSPSASGPCRPSGIRRFFDILATMDDVISLGVGEPDFDTPREIVEAGVERLREGRTHYTTNYGTHRAAAGAGRPPRPPLRRRLRPRDRAPDHGRGIRGRRPRAARDLRSGRRGDPPRAVVRRLRAGHRVRGRRGPSTSRPGSRTTSRSTRPRSRRRSRRARRRCSSATRRNPTGAVLATTSRTSSP